MAYYCDDTGSCGKIMMDPAYNAGAAKTGTAKAGANSSTNQAPENPLSNIDLPTAVTQRTYTPIANIPYYQMTDYAPTTEAANTHATESVNQSTLTPAQIQTEEGEASTTVTGYMPGETTGIVPDELPSKVFADAPTFKVPANPLLPPGYQEVLSYANLQYMNGFLRTQIGKYLRVQQLIGSSVIEERYGYLVGVGINYILLQEISTGNILTLDFYNIKYVYIYYTKTDLPTNEIK